MLGGYYVQLKTVAIKIPKEAGNLFSSMPEFLVFKNKTFTYSENSKTRTKMRRILTETKKKALETIKLLN
jgi:hypothetical protein